MHFLTLILKEKADDLCSLEVLYTSYYPSSFLYSDIINLFFSFEKMRNTETRLQIKVGFLKNIKSHRSFPLSKETKECK